MGEKGTSVRDNEEITCLCVAFFSIFSSFLFFPLRLSEAFNVDYFNTRQFDVHDDAHSFNSNWSSLCALIIRLRDNFR